MKVLGWYAAMAAVLIIMAGGALWPFLDDPGRSGVLAAAAIALPFQILAFAALIHWGNEPNRFLMVWGLGMFARLLVVAGAGLGRGAVEGIDPTVFLLSVCGFLFALLLLEPVFMSRRNGSVQFAQ